MKDKREFYKRIISCVGFMAGLIVILMVLSFVFVRSDGAEIYDGVSIRNKDHEIKSEPDNSIDVLFLGDSECYSSFNPIELLDITGRTSYVCGTSAQRICDTYAILNNAFATQSPEVVVLETNCLYRKTKTEDSTNDSVMNACIKALPVFANHSDWKNVAAKLIPSYGNKKDLENRGFVTRYGIKPYEGGAYMHKTDNVDDIDENTLKYLSLIYNLCDENGAKLLLVSVPSPKNWSYEKHNGVNEWATAHSVSYLDLNLVADVGIDWMTDTKDGGDHLNATGAGKVTGYLGEWFVKNL